MKVTEDDLSKWEAEKSSDIKEFYINISEGYGAYGIAEDASAAFNFKIFKLAQEMRMDLVIPYDLFINSNDHNLVKEPHGRISVPLAFGGGCLELRDFAGEEVYCHPSQLSGVMKLCNLKSLRDEAASVGLHILWTEVHGDALQTDAERLVEMFTDPTEQKRVADAIDHEMVLGGDACFNAYEDIHKPTIQNHCGMFSDSPEYLAIKAMMAAKGLPTGWVDKKKGGR